MPSDFTSKKTVLRLRFEILKLDFSIIKKIASLGISPFIMQSTESAIFVVFNTGLQKYGGDIYVGAMTIMQSVMQMIWIPLALILPHFFGVEGIYFAEPIASTCSAICSGFLLYFVVLRKL